MKLFAHQIKAIDKSKGKPGIALLHEPGLGKTLTALKIFEEQRKMRPELKLLVICPLSLIRSAWMEDIAKFTEFSSMSYKDMKNCDNLPDILIINYELLISPKHLKVIIDIIRKNQYMCAVDECSRMKNPTSKTTKTLHSIAHWFIYRIGMSGSPCPNNLLELWGSMTFVIPGILKPSFFQFRNTYFEMGRGTQAMPQGVKMTRLMLREMMMKGWKYQAKKGAHEAIMEVIAPYSDWVRKEEAIDLPETMSVYRDVYLSPEERKSYEEMKRHFITEISGSEIVAQNALTKMGKLRQAASGFLYNEAHQAMQTVSTSARLKELKNVIDELGNQQVIIWCEYREEARQIAEYLKSIDATHAILNGDTKDKDEEIRRFKSGEAQYLLANILSASHGLTLTNSHTAIYYSYSFSYEAHFQSRERILRISQTNKCLYIYLVVHNTLDDHILSVIKDKKDLNDVVYEFVRGLK